MKLVLLGFLGLLLGAVGGRLIGVGLGFAWTTVFQTSCFEGYCSMLVFFSFLPFGALLGAVAGAATLVVSNAHSGSGT